MNDAVVLDASVIVDVLMVPARVPGLAELVGEAVVAAPAHVDAEAASALSRLYRSGDLSANQVRARLAAIERMTIQRHPVGPLLTQAWQLRDNVSILDDCYVALARDLKTYVLTTDRRLARAHEDARLVEWNVSA